MKGFTYSKRNPSYTGHGYHAEAYRLNCPIMANTLGSTHDCLRTHNIRRKAFNKLPRGSVYFRLAAVEARAVW